MIPFDFKIRDFVQEDIDFIHNSWITSFYHFFKNKGIDKNWFCAAQDSLIKTMLSNNGRAKIVCQKSDEEQIFGYIVYELPNIVHWIYVKKIYRMNGLAMAMLENVFNFFKKDKIFVSVSTPFFRHHKNEWNIEFKSNLILRITHYSKDFK